MVKIADRGSKAPTKERSASKAVAMAQKEMFSAGVSFFWKKAMPTLYPFLLSFLKKMGRNRKCSFREVVKRLLRNLSLLSREAAPSRPLASR